jgi:hypothetical protein
MRFKYKNGFLKSKGFSGTLLAVLLLVGLISAQAPATGFSSIRADELREKVVYLASKELKGRGNGSPELRIAADYIAAAFKKNGLKTAGDSGTYLQNFRMFTARLGTGNSFRVDAAEYVLGTDYVPHYLSPRGDVEGLLVFVGYGLSAPRLKFDELAHVNLRGRIAVVIDTNPRAEDFASPFNRIDPADPASILVKARNAAKAGAVGLVVIQNPRISNIPIAESAAIYEAGYPLKDAPMGDMDGAENPRIPVLLLSDQAGRRLIPQLRDMQRRIDETLQPESVDLSKRASMKINVQRVPFATQNVLGLIEGRHASLRREVVIVGAHYDHDGEHNGQIWPGADDNASGTAGLIELAEAFGNGSLSPARSILLCAFAGEEKGAIGSKHYAENPAIPIDRTVAMLQMDMIGRNEEHGANKEFALERETSAANANAVNLIGTIFSADLRRVMEAANDGIGLDLKFRYDDTRENLLRRSDQWAFLEKRVPALFIHTGEHPDYHRPSDTADKINYPKMEKIVRLVYAAVLAIGNAEEKPRFVE